MTAGAPQVVQWVSTFPSMSKGHDLNDTVFQPQWYIDEALHGSNKRKWGPSSRHDRVVVHGYCDGHAEAMRDDITGTAYLALVTRFGREVAQDDNN
jgi:hypothetical protein